MRNLPAGFGRVSLRVTASYIFDWIFIIAIGLITYGLNKVNPVYHPFSLVDLSISYPYKSELISTTSLTLAAIVGPAIIIFLISAILVPGPYASKKVPIKMVLRRKFWEWNTGWLGLALSVIMALLITVGLKNIFGKPRPNMLALCQPDTSLESIQQHTVGSFAADYSPYWVLVDVNICTQQNRGLLNDGFRSFPSGHSSTSWSGLLYLSLYLCSKFAVVFPFLPGQPVRAKKRTQSQSANYAEAPSREQSMDTRRPILSKADDSYIPFNGRRNEAAAPPLYLLIMLILPLGVALFICATRFYDYRHHGFDIISGSLIGIFTSWFSFRLYHMPIARSSGWSWGPRSPGRAFGVGVGSLGYVSAEDMPQREEQDDLEMGEMRRRPEDRLDSPNVPPSDRDTATADSSGSRFAPAQDMPKPSVPQQ